MTLLLRSPGWKRRGNPTPEADDAKYRVSPPVSLLDRVPDALFSLDRDWRFSYLNPAAERLLGAPLEELLGQCLWGCFPETVGSIFEQQYRLALANGSAVMFEACHPPLGTWVEVHAYPSTEGLEIRARDITPGMRAAESLRRWARIDELRFRTLVEQAADIVGLLNADGTIRYVSKAVERVLGYAPETLIGRSVFQIVHPDDRVRLQRLIDGKEGRQDGAMPVECRLRHADGNWRFIELTGNHQQHDPDIAGLVVSARDMTWRKQMERELQTREASYEAIVDGSVVGIGVTDLSGHLLTANRALQSFLGYTEENLAGHTLAEYVHPDDAWEDAAEVFEDLARGRRQHYRQIRRLVRSDGDTVWGSIIVSLIHEPEGQPTFAIVMVEDITERQRAAVELAAARRRLAASREAERLLLARELHDGPMQDLLAVSYELARESALASATQPAGDPSTAMEQARKLLLAVVGQLRGVVGELRPPGLVEFGLPAALHGFVTGLQRAGGDALPAIHLDVDDRAAELPQALTVAVFRIVQESVRNALRHAEAREIVVELRMEPSSVAVQVRDDGRGFVVPDRLDDFARTGHFGLVGLAERVEHADGEFTVTSSPGMGATLTVRVPVAEAESDEPIDSRADRR
jgi:PAS domain S-box-containing protein